MPTNRQAQGLNNNGIHSPAMYIPLLPLLLTSLFAIRTNASLEDLVRRQSTIPCSQQGMKDCGNACIDLTDTCCPDKAGGCSLGTYCSLGSNGEYGCCRIGRTCVGPGGVNSDVNIFTSTRPISIRPISTPVIPPIPSLDLSTRRSVLGVSSLGLSLPTRAVTPLVAAGTSQTTSEPTTTRSQALIGGGNPTAAATGQSGTGDAGTGGQGALVLAGSLALILLGMVI